MKRADLKGQTVGDDVALYGYCKECGEFTLDVVNLLCASCHLILFFEKMSAIADRLGVYYGVHEKQVD